METCPGRFYAATENELWKIIELHASVAHNEDPTAWSPEERAQVKALIMTENSNFQRLLFWSLPTEITQCVQRHLGGVRDLR